MIQNRMSLREIGEGTTPIIEAEVEDRESRFQ